MNEYKELTWQGLWDNNPALVQLLGLCPLLAVTASVTNALGLGLATLFVLIGSNVTVSLVRSFVPQEIRIPVFVMVIATFVTVIQLLMNAYVFELYQSLGIFIPLIVTNCAIIGRAEAYASKNPWQKAAFDGLMMGVGFALVLMLLGAIREIIGNGTLFDGAELLLGDWAAQLRIELFTVDYPLLLAILPPGAFIGMGFIIALKNRIDAIKAERAEKKTVTRARVTAQQ
ncbi:MULTISPECIES: electron transport complex subunit E [Idiomarina]|jgi:electron transport complex protein RnfE|uniref:Ion-translocating oxidoreductase complex subunit E n=2 Tax=Idiomarina TaxID=135575 RepID=A0A837NG71_9GAMM|nr:MULTISPECIES: electron transport complex subunit E [Idiomarina]KTG23243.1 elongation factor G [Idiomarina sp. H105]OAE90636.1 electron transport complex subunit RsxE [Idiomarina sp. WRN-38]KPD25083.1 elongation factor G [Idiomarina zobellii]MCJ8316472.1 electron transport complex subunit E [Idiomarina sp.]NQZ15196.1 electron transport complex subunit E [Idiomarina sp.]